LASRALLGFAVALAVGVAVVLWRAGADERSVAFSLGAPPVKPVDVLDPGQEVCQTNFTIPTRVDGVSFEAGANRRPGMPLEVTVRDDRGRALATRHVRGGYPEHASVGVRLPPIAAGRTISLCIRNRGRAPGYAFGDPQVPGTGTVAGGRTSETDIALRFLRERPRSALSLVPTMFRRASLFRFGFVGAWTFWFMTAVIALAVPLLCALALARAARDDDAQPRG
jgi:hypothetical protein